MRQPQPPAEITPGHSTGPTPPAKQTDYPLLLPKPPQHPPHPRQRRQLLQPSMRPAIEGVDAIPEPLILSLPVRIFNGKNDHLQPREDLVQGPHKDLLRRQTDAVLLTRRETRRQDNQSIIHILF